MLFIVFLVEIRALLIVTLAINWCWRWKMQISVFSSLIFSPDDDIHFVTVSVFALTACIASVTFLIFLFLERKVEASLLEFTFQN